VFYSPVLDPFALGLSAQYASLSFAYVTDNLLGQITTFRVNSTK
jgi:hypothetical protein